MSARFRRKMVLDQDHNTRKSKAGVAGFAASCVLCSEESISRGRESQDKGVWCTLEAGGCAIYPRDAGGCAPCTALYAGGAGGDALCSVLFAGGVGGAWR